MRDRVWILVVESNKQDRLTIDAAIRSMSRNVEVACVDDYHKFITSMATHGSLPCVAILDWYAGGGDPGSCLDTLERLGFKGRLPLIATARSGAREAIEQAYRHGVTRFISKYPDDEAFKKKIAEAADEFVPTAHKLLSPDSALQLW